MKQAMHCLVFILLCKVIFGLRMTNFAMPYKAKIAVVGSGNWGTAVARRVAMNLNKNELVENKQVKMWVFEEEIKNRLLSDIINQEHKNPKYLPNVELPSNVVACTDLVETCSDADVILFVVPHQFLPGVLNTLKEKIKPTAIGVSLIKGIQFSTEGPVLLTEMIKNELGLLSTAAIMGANVASDVASDAFVEATVASIDINVAKTVASLFDCPEFQTEVSTDQSTVELCGALKNIIAVGAGFCDGLKLGVSSKAALIRQGTKETALFCRMFDRTGNHKTDTMLLSCGIADIIATCFGGRNRKCGQAFAERVLARQKQHNTLSISTGDLSTKLHERSELLAATADTVPNGNDGKKHSVNDKEDESCTAMWEEIESDLLDGQKLQGVDTCKEVARCLEATGKLHSPGEFPLFRRIFEILCKGGKMDSLFRWD